MLLLVAGLTLAMSSPASSLTVDQLIERHRTIEPLLCERQTLLRNLAAAPSGRRDAGAAAKVRERLATLTLEIDSAEAALHTGAADLTPDARERLDTYLARKDWCPEARGDAP